MVPRYGDGYSYGLDNGDCDGGGDGDDDDLTKDSSGYYLNAVHLCPSSTWLEASCTTLDLH